MPQWQPDLQRKVAGQLVNSCSWLPFACERMAFSVCEGLISDPGQSEGQVGGFLRTGGARLQLG